MPVTNLTQIAGNLGIPAVIALVLLVVAGLYATGLRNKRQEDNEENQANTDPANQGHDLNNQATDDDSDLKHDEDAHPPV